MNDHIFSGLSRGVPGLTPQQMTAPSSTFEAPENILNAPSMRYSPDKFFLGILGANIEQDEGQSYAQGGSLIGVSDDRHVITVAGSRAGKGRTAIVPNMLTYKGSIINIDPKGENARLTAKVRAERLGQKVYVVDPFNTTGGTLKEYETGFNPVSDKLTVEDAVLITDALVVAAGGDPHWDESAKTFIEGVLLETVTAERFGGRRNLVTVRDLITEGDSHEFAGQTEKSMGVLEVCMRNSGVGAVRRAAADFFEKGEKERDTVLSTARRHLRALSFPEIETSLKGQGFNLSDLKTDAVTIYLCLPARHIGTCGRWLRLFVNLALQAMEKTPGRPVDNIPVLFVLDEFAALGHMQSIEDAAGQIAGFGVKLWPILQDLGQLKALYRERWETFMGNAGVLQFFGNNDLTTLEWISKRLGVTTIEQRSRSDVTPGATEGGARGESYAPSTTAMMEPHEAALVFGRADPLFRQLIIRASYAPMILQKAFYDKHSAFAGLR